MELKIDNANLNENAYEDLNRKFSNTLKRLKVIFSNGGYMEGASFINLPFDESILKRIKDITEEKTSKNLKYIIVIGIGGSNLGAKAIYDAMYGYFDTLDLGRFPKIIFIDTNNTTVLKNFKNFLQTKVKDPSEFLVNIISKSGKTAETLFNAEFTADILVEKFGGSVLERFVVTTDKDSALWKESLDKNISLLEIPKKVGGRYSVFSAVGLLPLVLSRVDVSGLLEGAKEMSERCLSSEISNNPAMMSAATLFLNYENGKVINDNFFFNSELETLGKWYRQLMGESIGKDEKGITPTVSIGSTDLHSIGQLYLGGLKNKIISFIKSKSGNGVSIPGSLFPKLTNDIDDKNSDTVLTATFEGIKIAYAKRQVPFIEILLNDISPKSIGEFMQFKMLEMVYLGELLKVDVFNQPDVEEYKKETRRILSKSYIKHSVFNIR